MYVIYVNNTLPLALAVHERSGQGIEEREFEMLGEPTTNTQVDFKSNNALDTQPGQFQSKPTQDRPKSAENGTTYLKMSDTTSKNTVQR